MQIDSHYVGDPPPVEVSITNLNDNINSDFLTGMVKKFGVTEELTIFYHPKSNKHLGLAKLIFESEKSASLCVDKLHQTSVMGKIINVFLDPFGREVTKAFENAVNPPPPPKPVIASEPSADPLLSANCKNVALKNVPTALVADAPFAGFSYMETGLWADSHMSSKSRTNPDASPVRESLDTRIESLFLRTGKSFLGDAGGFTGSAPFDPRDFGTDSPGMRRRFTSLTIRNNRRSGRSRRRPAETFGTPPSPFLSTSDYIHSRNVTRAMEQGIEVVDLESESDYEDEFDDDSGSGTPLRDESQFRRRVRRSRRRHEDRGSSSSSSSTERTDPRRPAPQSRVPVHNPMYPSEHVQKLAELGLWKPGMGSAVLSQSESYQSRNSYHNSHHKSRPANDYADDYDRRDGRRNHRSHSRDRSDRDRVRERDRERETYPRKPRTKEERLNPLISGVIHQVVKELKEIIRKDIKRRMIESTGFKSFESWWDENESRSKARNKELLERNNFASKDVVKVAAEETNTAVHVKTEDVWSTINRNLHNSSPAKQPAFAGLGLGLSRLIPKMPSFRRKFKAPSPVPDDDWDAAEKPDAKEDSVPHSSESGDEAASNQLSGSSSDSDSGTTSSDDSDSNDSSSSSLSGSESENEDSDAEIKTKEKVSRFSSSSDESAKQDDELDTEHRTRSDVEDVKDDSQLAAEALVALAAGGASQSETPDRPKSKQDSGTDSAPELETLNPDLTKPVTSVDFDHSYALPSQTSAVDSVIDAVAKGTAKKNKVRVVVETAVDHGYSRSPTKADKKIPLKKEESRTVRPIASEWRKAKDKKLIDDLSFDLSPLRPITPQPQHRKRTVVEEMDILYDFLRVGIDEEDVQFMRRTYESMLQEESQYWLNDTHWVDHPATLIPSPKKRKKTDDVRVHVTGCARSEGYYKMDDNEKRQHSHVANVRSEEDNPKHLRARGAIAQTSTREARSYQRRLLATADAAWSDLLKFNQLQVCFCCSKLTHLLTYCVCSFGRSSCALRAVASMTGVCLHWSRLRRTRW